MRTRQWFEWVQNSIENKTYLLMPNEVDEFVLLISPKVGFTFNQAFTRLTGREVNSTMENLKLVVEYLPG